MKGWPVIHVQRRAGAGIAIRMVEWHDDRQTVDLTEMRVAKVETVIEPGSVPIVKVSFLARLVETEEEE